MRILNYAAQTFDALVVSNAVRRGSRSTTIFGSSRSMLSYMGADAVEDIVVDFATRKASCNTQAAAQGILAGSAIINSYTTGFPQ